MSKGSFRPAAAAAVAIAAVAALTGFARTSGAAAPAAFRTADGSTACAVLASGAVACRTRAAPGGVVLLPNGRSETTAVALTWTRRTDVLLAAESWWHGNIVCRAAGARVRCSADGATIAAGSAGRAPTR